MERSRLAGILWPESPDFTALHNLRQLLVPLRRELGEAKNFLKSIPAESLVLDVSADVFVDVLEFDTACEDHSIESLERAINLYSGALLANWPEPFAISAREDRVNAYFVAVDHVAAHYNKTKEYTSALRILRQAVEHDPHRQAMCLQIMITLTQSGQGIEALGFCRQFRSRLRKETKTDISFEIKTLYKKIRNDLTNPNAAIARKANRIPTPLTRLIGREQEIREVLSILQRCRLVALTGAGGVGKTRLSLAVADQAAEGYLDGACFVDLAPLHDSNMIGASIAAALAIEEVAGQTILETIIEKLQEKELLLILDNCEHLAAAVAEVVERILSALPGLHVLVTSRQTLGIKGELVWRVPSMSVHSEGDKPSEAVQLFLDRASRHAWSNSDLQAIRTICITLDGLPLAIELAAARTKVLSVKEIHSRLGDRFSLLTNGGSTLARHQTLRASIEWSWEMLSETERRLLMYASVFRGGFTLNALEKVCGGERVLDIVTSLVDRSLMNASVGENETRYWMLETIRQFGEQMLVEVGERDEAGERHLNFFLQWSEEGWATMMTPAELKWFERFAADHDNLRSALSFAHETGRREKELQLVVALARFWDTCGYLNEGRNHLERALDVATDDEPAHLRASAHLNAGWIATMQTDNEAAIAHYQQALPEMRREENVELATLYSCMGNVFVNLRDYRQAQASYELALGICTKLGRENGIAMQLCNLADLMLEQDEMEMAIHYIRRDVEAAERPGTRPSTRGLVLTNLSYLEYREGKYEQARSHALEAMRLLCDESVVVHIPRALLLLGFAEFAQHNWERAARLLGAAKGIFTSQGAIPSGFLLRELNACCKRLGEELGDGPFENEFGRGMDSSVDDAVAHVLSKPVLA